MDTILSIITIITTIITIIITIQQVQCNTYNSKVITVPYSDRIKEIPDQTLIGCIEECRVTLGCKSSGLAVEDYYLEIPTTCVLIGRIPCDEDEVKEFSPLNLMVTFYVSALSLSRVSINKNRGDMRLRFFYFVNI